MFSPKRAAAVKKGKVVFNIYDENDQLLYSYPNFIIAVQMLEYLQEMNPCKKLDMKVELAKGEQI